MIEVLFIILIFALVIAMPISLALALASGIYLFLFMGYMPDALAMLAQPFVTSADSFSLMAIPFFMLAGSLMAKSGIAQRIIGVAEAISGRAPGGLGSATVVACMFFAAISGSGPATVAAIGGFMIPAMRKRNYDPGFAAALTATAGGIGVVIPPSIPMIVYGSLMGVSVSKLFLAGFIPGIVIGFGLIIVTTLVSMKRGYVGIEGAGSFMGIIKIIWAAKFALIMPVIILGGIYGGIFTPTEAAVVASVYAIIIGVFVYRTITLKLFIDCLIEAAVMNALVMILLGGAQTFGRILTLERTTETIAQYMLSLTDSRIMILLMINAFLLITGCFLDTISNVILLSPIFLPIVVKVGVDPIHFGIIMVVNLAIGFVSPPLGMNLFVASGVSGVSFEKIVKSIIPFFAVSVITLLLITYVPWFTLWLPRVLGY